MLERLLLVMAALHDRRQPMIPVRVMHGKRFPVAGVPALQA